MADVCNNQEQVLNSFIETGPVISLARVISTFALISCPGATSSKPACAAKIFSVIFSYTI